MGKTRKRPIIVGIVGNSILIIASIVCIMPLWTVLMASVSGESELIKYGFGFIPRGFTLDAYRIVFESGNQIFNAYIVSAIVTVVGTTLNLAIDVLAAYPLSRPDYKWRSFFNFFVYFTTVFSGGAIANYIWITQGLGLRNNPIVLVAPTLADAGSIFLLRTYMSKIPHELIEAAKIDGAGELKIYFKMVLPLCVTGLATVLVMLALGYWNSWYASLMYLSDDKYMTIQYYLVRVMNEIDAILNSSESVFDRSAELEQLPSESARMAICIIAAGPMVFIFSFFQKFFVGGIALGSVKG